MKTSAEPSSSPRRSLVSGGAGFIGSHLTELLLQRGDHVTVVDDLSTGRVSNLDVARQLAPDRLRFIEAELGKALNTFGPGEHFDQFYHLAASVGVKRVMDRPIESIDTNILETSAALRFASERKIAILIASSSEVYGKPTTDVFREDDDVIYGPTTITRWSYACSKAIDEFLALAYHAKQALPVVVVRFFNTIGPRQVGEYGMVVPRFVQAALAGQPLEVHGDGSQSRCFCDVRDVVRVLPALLEKNACHGRIYNVGSDQPISIRSLAENVVRVTQSSSTIRTIAYAQAFGPGAGFEDLRHRRPSLERIRSATSFQPQISLDVTIRDVAAFLKSSLPIAHSKSPAKAGVP